MKWYNRINNIYHITKDRLYVVVHTLYVGRFVRLIKLHLMFKGYKHLAGLLIMCLCECLGSQWFNSLHIIDLI